MAGSLKYFNYTADDGEVFALFGDESNIKQINSGGDVTATTKYKIPSNLKPRYATYQSANGTVRRDLIALTAASLAAIDAGDSYADPVSGLTVTLKRKVGEVLTLPNLADTGLNDGTP